MRKERAHVSVLSQPVQRPEQEKRTEMNDYQSHIRHYERLLEHSQRVSWESEAFDKSTSQNRWLVIVACVTLLLVLSLVVARNLGTPFLTGNGFSDVPSWNTILLLSLPSTVGSILFCWHHLVNKARRPSWSRGLVAAVLASVLSYPLGGFCVGLLLGLFGLFSSPGWLVIGPVYGLVVGCAYLFTPLGLCTSLAALVLGSCLGGIQRWTDGRRAHP